MMKKFFNNLDKIDTIINNVPSEILVSQEIIPLIKDDKSRKYFFENITSPNWIQPIFDHNIFQNPPEPIKQNGGYINPPWPESQYLARMAKSAPELVIQTILKIPETDNGRIHLDFIDAACSMPAHLSTQWVEREIEWIKKKQDISFLLPQKYLVLVSHLLEGRQDHIALKLVATLLSLFPDPARNSENISKGLHDITIGPKAKSRLEDWEYAELIRKTIPELIKLCAREVIQLLINLLADAIKFSQYPDDAESQEDNSFAWRQSIEDQEENYPSYDLRDVLVSTVRDSAISLVTDGDTGILELLERESFSVFKRIGLYLRQIFPNLDPSGTAKILVSPEFFDNYNFHHEYYHLLNKEFPKLFPDIQEKYFCLVNKGKDMQKWVMTEINDFKRQPDQNAIERESRNWRYHKLLPIKDYLNKEWLDEFIQLQNEFGELSHPDYLIYTGPVFVGPTSPKSSDELNSMNVSELIEYLRSWQPSGKREDTSPEGLGRALELAIAANPGKFVTMAQQFQQLDPTYVRAFFSGLWEANKNQHEFDWKPVLELSAWVVDQPREIPDRKSEYGALDSDWGWTRRSIATLLKQGFVICRAQIPYTLRQLAWEIIEILTNDPEPTPEHERQYGGSNMDPATLSINTVRGNAMHAVIKYALWVKENQKPKNDDEKKTDFNFTQIPEVEQILDFHLIPEKDPSFAIRAVYGQWFPWLVLLDSDWASRNTKNIFPADVSQLQYWQAAWETYIGFCNIYETVFDIIKDEYFKAIDYSKEADNRKTHFSDPNQRLAEHLMVLYWRAKIGLNEKNEMLDCFYRKSPAKLHKHALIYVGQKLKESQIAIKPEVIDRLKELWEYRFEKLQNNHSDESKSELEAFGLWFISEKFDDDWSLIQLQNVLKSGSNVDRVHNVLEHLKNLSESKPLASIECLNFFTQDNKISWYLEAESYRETVKTILRNGLKSDNEQVQQIALENVHRLGALGFFDFRDLIL